MTIVVDNFSFLLNFRLVQSELQFRYIGLDF